MFGQLINSIRSLQTFYQQQFQEMSITIHGRNKLKINNFIHNQFFLLKGYDPRLHCNFTIYPKFSIPNQNWVHSIFIKNYSSKKKEAILDSSPILIIFFSNLIYFNIFFCVVLFFYLIFIFKNYY